MLHPPVDAGRGRCGVVAHDIRRECSCSRTESGPRRFEEVFSAFFAVVLPQNPLTQIHRRFDTIGIAVTVVTSNVYGRKSRFDVLPPRHKEYEMSSGAGLDIVWPKEDCTRVPFEVFFD